MEEFSHVELKFLRLEKYLKNRGNKSAGRRRHDLENKIWNDLELRRSGGRSTVPKKNEESPTIVSKTKSQCSVFLVWLSQANFPMAFPETSLSVFVSTLSLVRFLLISLLAQPILPRYSLYQWYSWVLVKWWNSSLKNSSSTWIFIPHQTQLLTNWDLKTQILSWNSSFRHSRY